MAFDLLTRKQNSSNWALGESDDPYVWTPAAVKGELMRVLGIVDTVNLDVSKALLDDKITKAEWEIWRQNYIASHKFLSSSSSLWGSNVLVARQHEQNALKWRDFIEQRGGTLQGPKNPGRPKENWTTAEIALAVGGAVGGIAATAMLVSAIRKK